MKKFIAICFFLWSGLAISVVSLIGLCLLGPVCAAVWGLIMTLYAAPHVYDVVETAWK